MTDIAAALRPFDPVRDWPAAAALITTCHLHDSVDWLPSPAVLEQEWTTQAGFEPKRDVRVVEEATHGLIALVNADWRERDGRFVGHAIELWVRPDHRRQRLGTVLLEWAEGHARELARSGRAGRRDWPHVIGGWGDVLVPGHVELARRHGYEVHRHGWEMLRLVADGIAEYPLPPGLEVRPVDPSQHRAIWDADVEAFRDHHEPADRTEEDYRAWFSDLQLDTTLWQVAWDGDVVAGSVMTSVHPDENEQLGVKRAWLDHVSVRRPWRGRGLAASLVASTIRLLRERGIEEAALGVDAENPSGALRLYEKLGFEKRREAVGYRKALEL